MAVNIGGYMVDIICLAVTFTCMIYSFLNLSQLMNLKAELDAEDRAPVTFAVFVCLFLTMIVSACFFDVLFDMLK